MTRLFNYSLVMYNVLMRQGIVHLRHWYSPDGYKQILTQALFVQFVFNFSNRLIAIQICFKYADVFLLSFWPFIEETEMEWYTMHVYHNKNNKIHYFARKLFVHKYFIISMFILIVRNTVVNSYWRHLKSLFNSLHHLI